MTTPNHETPMMHTHTIEAANHLSEAMSRKLESLSLDYTEIKSSTHTMFVIPQHTEEEREAVRRLGRDIAAYEQKQYEKISSHQSVEEAKKLRRMNLLRIITLRQPLDALPKSKKEETEAQSTPVSVNVPEPPVQAPTV